VLESQRATLFVEQEEPVARRFLAAISFAPHASNVVYADRFLFSCSSRVLLRAGAWTAMAIAGIS